MEQQSKKYFLLILLIAVLVVSSFVLVSWWNPFNWNVWNNIFHKQVTPIACTMEAKLCPDGSSVGRTGPKCEFAVCPINSTADWKTYTNTQYGFEVKYPSDWKITDKSMTDAKTNVEYPAVNIESPLRSDLTGYQGIPVSYRILIYKPEGITTSIADFGSNQKPAQSWWNIEVSKTVKEASPEYLIGQQIIATFKFTAPTIIDIKEQSCINSGGKVSTVNCNCPDSATPPDFYSDCRGINVNTCFCDPALDIHKQIKICACPSGECFDGTKCVILSH